MKSDPAVKQIVNRAAANPANRTAEPVDVRRLALRSFRDHLVLPIVDRVSWKESEMVDDANLASDRSVCLSAGHPVRRRAKHQSHAACRAFIPPAHNDQHELNRQDGIGPASTDGQHPHFSADE